MSGDRPEETAAEPEPRLVTAVRYRLRLAVSAAARQADTEQTAALLREAERRGLSSNELFAVAERHWPQPRLRARARRAGQRWVAGGAGWAWIHRPRRQARRPGPVGAPTVTGPLARRRQRRRRRMRPNPNTSTTTTISTHSHVDMAASLVGAGAGQADTTAVYPGKQLPGVQALSWAGIDGCAPKHGGRARLLRADRVALVGDRALPQGPRAGRGQADLGRCVVQDIAALTLASDLRGLRLAQRSGACSARLPGVGASQE